MPGTGPRSSGPSWRSLTNKPTPPSIYISFWTSLDPQGAHGAALARCTSSIPCPLCTDQLVMAQLGGTVVRPPVREADQARGTHFGQRIESMHRRLPVENQRRSQAVHVDQVSRYDTRIREAGMPNHAAGPCPRHYADDFWHTTLDGQRKSDSQVY